MDSSHEVFDDSHELSSDLIIDTSVEELTPAKNVHHDHFYGVTAAANTSTFDESIIQSVRQKNTHRILSDSSEEETTENDITMKESTPFKSGEYNKNNLLNTDFDDVMKTPREVRAEISSPSPTHLEGDDDDDDIISVSSDEETPMLTPIKGRALIQTSIIDHFRKKIAANLEAEQNKVSPEELLAQEEKVEKLQAALAKSTELIRSLDLDSYSNKDQIVQRHDLLLEKCSKEREKLEKMQSEEKLQTEQKMQSSSFKSPGFQPLNFKNPTFKIPSAPETFRQTFKKPESTLVTPEAVLIESDEEKFEVTHQNFQLENEPHRKWQVETFNHQSEKETFGHNWEDLQAQSDNVQPRTFGKQAMATYNTQKSLTMERLEQLHGAIATRPAENQTAEDPKGLKVKLMEHQGHGLAWLLWREQQKPRGGILADDMGLGKTLQLISLVLKSKEINEEEEANKENDSDDEENEAEKSKRRHKYEGGTLVVCPASLLNQWENEVKQKVRRGLLDVELYHGNKREPKAKRLARHDIVITTYGIVQAENVGDTALFTVKWERVILDEGHQIRNHKARTSLAVCNLKAKYRWVLTGTPVHNKELDLYALLKFLRCTPFDDLAVWKRWVADKVHGGENRLHTVLSSILLRRTKAQLEEKGTLTSLPSKNWELIQVTLSKQEMNVYQKVLIFSRTLFAQYLHQKAAKKQDYNEVYDVRQQDSEYFKMHKKLIKTMNTKEVKQHDILVLLLRLRQICCHLALTKSMLENGEDIGEEQNYDEETEEVNLMEMLNKLELEEKGTNEEEIEGGEMQLSLEKAGLKEATRGMFNIANPIFSDDAISSKVKAVLETLREKILPGGDKAVIVSQWSTMLRLIGRHLKYEGVQFEQLDGTVPVPKRMGMVDNFNDPKSTVKVFLLSLTAGGVGLNLVGGNHLLLVDLHWNPQLENQAQDRIYRLGQKKSVHIYKFITVDTIEERVKQLQEKKLELANSTLTGAKIQSASKLSLDDLKLLFNM